jgi:hypothetical protein
MATGRNAQQWLDSKEITSANVKVLFNGTGTADAPDELDSKLIIDATTGLTQMQRWEGGEWVFKSGFTGSVNAGAFFLEVIDGENEATTRQGLIFHDATDLSTIGQPKAIPLVRRSYTPDAVALGSPRWETIMLGADGGCLQYHYLEGTDYMWGDNDGTDTSTETTIYNSITPTEYVYCEDLEMQFSGTLVSPRTRIYKDSDGSKIYDSSNDADWENDKNQVTVVWAPDGGKANLNSTWEFFLLKDETYTIRRDVKDPITAYGVQDGEVFKPYLGLKLQPLLEVCIVHENTLKVDYKDANFVAECNLKTYNVDTTGGSIAVDATSTDLELFHIQDAKGNWSNVNTVTVNVGTDSILFGTQGRRQIYTFVRKDTVFWVYNGLGKFVQELAI